ncbi:molybdenum cofactor guanylyltransferase [Arthrobacter sp. UKPF54-2]|uniref:molybdenum cofactor guanylyltransferase n=1 Tax=Arthrobacter sp. UKPF54-2 TaxID=2600159 RepID=UPI001C9860EB|nr:NTP transferase domain-containing protein [Arthrobacter sp. UKPF54-2]
MEFDAVILAGGRSSRLGGVPKARLTVAGATLLELALKAAGGARRIVVVGPDTGGLPPQVLSCREEPPFAGPAAAIAAGLAALAGADAGAGERTAGRPAAHTLVLACDMPRVAAAVGALLAAADGPAEGPGGGRDGVMAVARDGRSQPLAGLYRTAALQRAVGDAARRNALEGGSVFALLASLELRTVPVPPGSTDDVDTWDDASALGVSDPGPGRPGNGRPNSTLEANGEKPG